VRNVVHQYNFRTISVREFGQLHINNGRKQAEKVTPQRTANTSNGGGDYSVKLRNGQPTHDGF
jgi:hypothetical protein